MGTICSTTRKTFRPLQRTSGFTVTLQNEKQKNVQLSGLPTTYQALLTEVSRIYTIPKAFAVLKTQKNGREYCICDEETYLTAVGGLQTGNIAITVFFPDRQAIIATKSTGDVAPRVELEGGNEETWGILHPVPIDVELHSRSSMSQSRRSSLLLTHKEPRTVQCLASCLLMFDAVTCDSFKYLADTIDAGSRAIQLTPSSLLVTGGLQVMTQHLRLDIADASFKRLPNLSQARHSHASVSLVGIVWAIGGMEKSELSHCEAFDGEVWVRKPPLNVARRELNASTWGTNIYVYGGNGEATIEKYEREGWFELSVRLPYVLALPGVYQEDENSALVAGGVDKKDKSAVFRLNFDQGSCEFLTSLPTPDHFMCEAIAYKEEYYFQGATVTQLYSPATNRWRTVSQSL